MKRATWVNLAQLIVGILIFVSGFRDNPYRYIPKEGYLIFGGVLVLYSVWKLFVSVTEED